MSRTGFTIQWGAAPCRAEVLGLRGVEELSKPFRLDLDLALDGEPDAATLLGSAARVEGSVGGKTRVWSGVIRRVRRSGLLGDGRLATRVRIGPHLSSLALRRVSRVFQNRSTVEIVSTLLREHGQLVRSELVDRVARDVCIQHDETDLAFVERLLAEEGIASRLECDADTAGMTSETLVLFDAATYPELVGGSRFALRAAGGSAGGLHREEHFIASFRAIERDRPERAMTHEFSFLRPDVPIEDAAGRSNAELAEVREHHGIAGEAQVGLTRAEVVLDQARRGALTFEGAAESPRLKPGFAISLEDHDVSELNGEYAITSVRHTLRQRAKRGEATSGANEPTYTNTFTAVRRDLIQRPKRPRRRVRQSAETATVVGPPGEAVHTDGLGRVKVHFHWDIEGQGKMETSCWIRVAQAWAGTGFGAQFVPRVGMEVLVTFLGGDPDRPVVAGCLPNATHPPPFQLPGGRTRTGWLTRSVPSLDHAGGNELSFEDSAGGEQIRLVAQRDLDVSVTHDMRTEVSGRSALQVAGAHLVSVRGSFSTSVEGESSTRVSGDAGVVLGGDSVERVAGDRRVVVGGSTFTEVGGVAQHRVAGDRSDVVEGTWTNTAGSRFQLVVGDASHAGHAETQVRGTSITRVDGRATIESGEALVLRCGESRIELAPDTITIHAPNIRLVGTESVSVVGKGPSLRLGERAEIASDDICLRSKEASLSLGTTAALKGSSIHLARGDAPRADVTRGPSPDTQRVSVILKDELRQPYAKKRYELRAAGKTFEGTTDADGHVVHDVPAEAKLAYVEVWPGDYPEGPRKSFPIALDELPGADTLPGVRARLSHLGYFRGPIDVDCIDDVLRGAIRAFERAERIDVTGELDDIAGPNFAATLSRLIEVHGH